MDASSHIEVDDTFEVVLRCRVFNTALSEKEANDPATMDLEKDSNDRANMILEKDKNDSTNPTTSDVILNEVTNDTTSPANIEAKGNIITTITNSNGNMAKTSIGIDVNALKDVNMAQSPTNDATVAQCDKTTDTSSNAITDTKKSDITNTNSNGPTNRNSNAITYTKTNGMTEYQADDVKDGFSNDVVETNTNDATESDINNDAKVSFCPNGAEFIVAAMTSSFCRCQRLKNINDDNFDALTSSAASSIPMNDSFSSAFSFHNEFQDDDPVFFSTSYSASPAFDNRS